MSVPALIAGPGVLFLLLGAKMLTKFVGVYPVTRFFKSPTQEGGRALFERRLLGSVSRVVIAYARCVVLVIR